LWLASFRTVRGQIWIEESEKKTWRILDGKENFTSSMILWPLCATLAGRGFEKIVRMVGFKCILTASFFAPVVYLNVLAMRGPTEMGTESYGDE